MVSAMISAYEALPKEDRVRVFLLAVGQDDYKVDNQNFCKGFAACADEIESPWWMDWNAQQRDIFFYKKADPEDNSSWELYRRYSMDDNKVFVGDTIQEMLGTEPESECAYDTGEQSDDRLGLGLGLSFDFDDSYDGDSTCDNCIRGTFCNYDDDDDGFCEECSEMMVSDNCYESGLPDKGAKDCEQRCFGSSSSSKSIAFLMSSAAVLGWSIIL